VVTVNLKLVIESIKGMSGDCVLLMFIVLKIRREDYDKRIGDVLVYFVLSAQACDFTVE